MKNKISMLILFIIAAIFFSSCATILSGTSDKIYFGSQPPGADVSLDGEKIGTTGNDVEVNRKFKGERQVIYKKDGYRDETFVLKQKIVGAYWLNLPTNLCVFCFVDIVTGAAMKPRDNRFEKTLIPVK